LATATDAATSAGRAPSGPERLRPAEWLAVFKRTGKQFLADDCMGLSQQIAYSSLLAFFPAVVFLVAVLGLIGAYDTLQSFLNPVAPKSVTDIIKQLQQDSGGSGSAVAAAFGAFGAVWAGSGAMGSVVKAVNRAHNRLETRSFWKVRLISLVLVLTSGFVLAGMLLLIVFGGKLGDAIARKAQFSGAFTWFWDVFRWPVAFVGVLLLFALIYYLAPNAEQRSWKWITPGSLVGSLMWLVLSGLFTLYTAFSSSYSKTYGSLAGGIVLLLWLNYSAWAVLFGAELNAELGRHATRPMMTPRAPLDAAGSSVKPARRMQT
jgi:membrane protein